MNTITEHAEDETCHDLQEEYIRLLAKDRLQRRIVACTKVQVHVHGRAPAGPDSSSRINLTVKPRSELGQALENVQLLEDLKRMKRNLGIFPVYTAARYYVNRRRAQKDVRNLADKPSHLKHMLDLWGDGAGNNQLDCLIDRQRLQTARLLCACNRKRWCTCIKIFEDYVLGNKLVNVEHMWISLGDSMLLMYYDRLIQLCFAIPICADM